MPKPEPKSATMSAAAARLGVDLSLVRYAKRAGCKAFESSGRVRTDELKEWIDAHTEEIQAQPAVSKEQADIRLKLQKYDIEDWRHKVERGKYRKASDVFNAVEILARDRKAQMQLTFEVELPAKLVGLGVIEITEIMKAAVDRLHQKWSDRATGYGLLPNDDDIKKMPQEDLPTLTSLKGMFPSNLSAEELLENERNPGNSAS